VSVLASRSLLLLLMQQDTKKPTQTFSLFGGHASRRRFMAPALFHLTINRTCSWEGPRQCCRTLSPLVVLPLLLPLAVPHEDDGDPHEDGDEVGVQMQGIGQIVH
jgi:hypothetical protein